MNKIYSTFELKSIDNESRTLTGIATNTELDRQGDVVETSGLKWKLPIPFLLGHDSNAPIGNVIEARATAAGLEIKAQIAKVDEPGPLQDRLSTAWLSIRSRIIRGLSIGFRALESTRINTGLRFLAAEILEISAVAIPANPGAVITTIKMVKEHDAEWRRRHLIFNIRTGHSYYR